MTQPSIWGPPIWKFFHVLIAKIKDDSFKNIYIPLFYYIKRICSQLPCPECSNHATHFLSTVKIEHISNKNDFKHMLHYFHNKVNLRKIKPNFPRSEIDKYKNFLLIPTYNNFIRVYNTKGNLNMLTESFQRQIILSEFKKWFLQNIHHFHY
jgi:hypothetical protein